jgi:hypothetical protein
MEIFLTKLFGEYGPLALGWIVACLLGVRALREAAASRITAKDVLKEYKELLDSYHEAIVDNTKITERLALLIEDRTRQQLKNNGQ